MDYWLGLQRYSDSWPSTKHVHTFTACKHATLTPTTVSHLLGPIRIVMGSDDMFMRLSLLRVLGGAFDSYFNRLLQTMVI